jgi:beta-galactosidase
MCFAQVMMSVEAQSAASVDVISRFVLQPHTKAGIGHVVKGVGVGEVGGAHWFSGLEGPPQATTISQASVPSECAPDEKEGAITVTARFTVHAYGSIAMEWEFDASHALPASLPAGLTPSLPRVGLRCRVPSYFKEATWYGMGPHECYPDRMASAHLRQHSS